MKARIYPLLVVVAFAAAVLATAEAEGGRAGGLAELAADADTIVAVEVLKTDYKATAADGPMSGDASVLKIIKGAVPHEKRLEFQESAWCGPTYKTGEKRILFLKRVTSKDRSYSPGRWATLCSMVDKIDFFFSEDSLTMLSATSLEAFLREIQAVRRTPPKIAIELAKKESSALVLTVRLSNDARHPIWLNPSRIWMSFEANNVYYSRDVEFDGEKPGAWIEMAPGHTIAGTIRIARDTVKGTERLVLLLNHLAVHFPNPSWAGTVTSAPVKVGNAVEGK